MKAFIDDSRMMSKIARRISVPLVDFQYTGTPASELKALQDEAKEAL